MTRSKSKPPSWLVEGVMVDFHAVIDEPATQLNMRVRVGPQWLPSGHWVVWLEGKAGCVAVEACTRAQAAASVGGSGGQMNCPHCASLTERVTALENRQQELLQTIVRLTNETPFPDELKGWEAQRRALIAQVGTLRAQVAELGRLLGDAS